MTSHFDNPTRSDVYHQLLKIGGEGILTIDDLPQLKSQRRKVFLLLLDGQWHTGPEIIEATGGMEGLRRMRELRQIPWLQIDRKRSSQDSRTFMYRMRVIQPPIKDQKSI